MPEDPEVRELVHELIASAPVPPPLPDASVVRSMRRARRTVALSVALASLVAVVAGVVWATNRDGHKQKVVIEQPSTSFPPTSGAPSTSTQPTSTTVAVPAHSILPAGTAFIGITPDNGDVFALDGDGRPLRTLFNAGVENNHHWPTINHLQLAPDAKTLWYAKNATGFAPCSSITERDLATGSTRVRFQGSWFALSPDGTRLAYAGCTDADPTVYIVDLASNDTWTARAPGLPNYRSTLGRVAWTADGKQVLAEYINAAAQWPLVTLTPTDRPGAIPWGPTVLTLTQEDMLTTTPTALYVSAGSAGAGDKWSIDSYNWSYHLIRSVPTNLGPLEIVVHDGTTYVMGGPFTGGSGYATNLYRLEPTGTTTELRPGIGDVVAVPVSSTPIAAGPVPCTASQVRFALNDAGQSVMQQPAAFFSFTNTSSTACTLDGYPAFEPLDASGRAISSAMGHGGAYQLNDPGPRVVIVDPGQAVYFGFGWTDVAQPSGTTDGCVHVTQARVRLPGDNSSMTATARLNSLMCPGGGSVTAIAPRAAFTIAVPK